ncbi:CCA tRNA nucleotidyltransferase [Candidatus Micrarchaeota archaeon CG10_big_fil_rev_8_21_14_0_10_59_7]|nr:MAG: CCA tRNA nucleotidyltransferase [Candidatus Micrarchaeota archaeon CG10_big_fil_rev_8_21_14_0_10_59_7]
MQRRFKARLGGLYMQHAIDSLAERVSKKITPSKAEADSEKAFAAKVSAALSKSLPKQCRVCFVGSAARDTGLRGSKDIDLFVSFPRSFSKEEIVAKTFRAARRALKAKWEKHYAEHPYLQAQHGAFRIEVIPCFETSPHEELKSAVDRSPLHMDYLQKRLTETQRRDVRVLKQFLKNAGLYGAELRIQGFSGLLCEYLVLNYRSFKNVVEAAAQWAPPVVVDMEGHYAERRHPFAEPLVVIDAIDKNRNAAAVISETNLYKFIALCRAFRAKPSASFFFGKRKKHPAGEIARALKNRGTAVVVLKIAAPKLVEDILYPQLHKTERALARHLTLQDFRVLGTASFVSGGNAFFVVECESAERPRLKRLRGPPMSSAKAVADFVRAHKGAHRGPYIEGGRVFAERSRAATFLETELKALLRSPDAWGAASHFVKPLKLARTAPPLSLKADALQEFAAYLFRRESWW